MEEVRASANKPCSFESYLLTIGEGTYACQSVSMVVMVVMVANCEKRVSDVVRTQRAVFRGHIGIVTQCPVKHESVDHVDGIIY